MATRGVLALDRRQFASEDGSPNLDVWQALEAYLIRVGLEHHKVSALSGANRADRILGSQYPGGFDGDGSQCRIEAQPLRFADDVSPNRLTRTCCPRQPQWFQRRHRAIGMQRQWDSLVDD